MNDVCSWLNELGLNQYSEVFRTNEIDGAELANIDNKTLSEDLGIGEFLYIPVHYIPWQPTVCK